MSKFLCIFSTAISAILFLVFVLDIVAGVPFKKANPLFDIVFIVAMLGIATLGVLCLLKQK